MTDTLVPVPTPTPAGSPQQSRLRWIMLSLIVLTLVCYAWVGKFGFINYDDPKYITDNAQVADGFTFDAFLKSFTSIEGGYRHPVTWWTHYLDVSLYGATTDSAGGHHVTSLLLHTANATLLFWVLYRLTAAVWPSAWVAAVFAVHPAHAESVAWIAERKDVLSCLFFLLTIWAYQVYTERKTFGQYMLVLLAFAAALMSKPMMVTTPVILLLLDFWPLRRVATSLPAANAVAKRCATLVLEKLPLFALSALSGWITIRDTASIGSFADTSLFPLGFRLQTTIVAYARYLGKLVWPSNLSIFYPFPEGGWPVGWVAGSLLLFVVLTAVAIWQAKKRPYLLFGWLWFVVVLLPVVGLLVTGEASLADRYTYVSFIGVLIAVAWLVRELAHKAKAPFVAAGLAGLTVAACIVVLMINLPNWKSSTAIMSHALAVTDRNWTANLNLGLALRGEGKIDESCKYIAEAYRLRPGATRTMLAHARCLIEAGDLAGAEPLIVEARKIDQGDPAMWLTAGLWQSAKGDHRAAIARAQAALKLKPRNEEAERLMANSLLMLGQIDAGEKHLRNALAINPNAAAVHHRLGQIASMRRDYDAAAESYRIAVAIDPKFGTAHADYGTLLAQMGRTGEASQELLLALQTLPPGDLSGRSLVEMNIGRLLERGGQALPAAERYMNAVNLAEQAVAARPTDATAHLQLASTLQYTGQTDKARASADQAMELAVKSNNQVLIAQLRAQFKHFPQPTTAPSTNPTTQPAK